jgi:acylphosphatase
MMDRKRVQVVIHGRVQGVGFRASCQRQAGALGVTGWVRNSWDDSVEALFEGPTQAVDAMVGWCRHGPPAAEVAGVEVIDAPPGPPLGSFSIRG